MNATLRIALVEYDILWELPEENFSLIRKLLSTIDADLFLLPEMFSYGFSMNVNKIAEDTYSKSFKFLQKMAILKNAVFCASIPTRDKGSIYNRLYWIEPNETFYSYDKRHLFSYGDEHLHYTAGSQPTQVECNGWRILPLICYDLRFPVYSRNHPKEPYDLLLYIANWPKKRAYAWNHLLVARAIENMAYVAAVNRTGCDPKLSYQGDSQCIDFLGNPMSAIKKEEGVSIFELNKDTLESSRKEFGFLNDSDSFNILF